MTQDTIPMFFALKIISKIYTYERIYLLIRQKNIYGNINIYLCRKNYSSQHSK